MTALEAWLDMKTVKNNHNLISKKEQKVSLKERFEILFGLRKIWKSLKNSLRELQKFLKIFLRTFWSSLKIEEKIPLNSKDHPLARKGGAP